MLAKQDNEDLEISLNTNVENKYCLRVKKTGELAKYSIRETDGDGVPYQHSIEKQGDYIWFADSPEHAEYVRLYSTAWYNADYDTPTNNYNPEDLEVVKVSIVVNAEPVSVEIPTIYEVYRSKYEKSEPEHLANVKKLIEEGRVKSYYYFELQEYLASQKETI